MKTNNLYILLIFTLALWGFNHLSAQEADEMIYSPGQENLSKDTRVYYSVFVQSFYDSNNDGIGDLKGLTSQLEYLKELGIGGLSLLPIHPSPSYHKFDVTDYKKIHNDYGSINDFKNLVNKAHELDMKIIIDLVVNHTSHLHPWFKKAVEGNAKYRNFYLWSNKDDDFEKSPYQWHQVRDEDGKVSKGKKYYGYYWWEMPDLNMDNQKLREEIFSIGRFWLQDAKVDGFRLDGADLVYEPEQSNKSLLWWKEFHQEMEIINPDVILIGEIMDGSDAVSPFLKSGFTSGINFELADTIKQSILKGTDTGILSTFNKIDSTYRSVNPDFHDVTLLTNHDMERVMTQFNRDDNKAKLAAALLLTLPGNPFIYYGEEIGMLGEKPDEYIREPFVWNVEGEDPGQTHWEIPYASSSRTVKPLIYQTEDRASVYNHYKNLINLRNENSALNKGDLYGVETNNPKIIAFHRYSRDQNALVIINLSSEMERIKTFGGMDNFEMAFSNFNVFKINDKEISLQPYAIFVLTRVSEYVR